MDTRKRNIIEIHIAVVLFGLSGLFGKSIGLPALHIVLGRVFFATLSLGAVILIKKENIRLKNAKEYIVMAVLGLLTAIHFITFFKSVQLSTVAIAMLTFSAYPVLVTFCEPFVYNEKLKLIDIIIAITTFIGVCMIVPEFSLENEMTMGMVWGIGGCLSFAAVSLLNRNFASNYGGLTINFYEQAVSLLALLPLLFFELPPMTKSDIIQMAVLGVIFTGLAHALFIGGMKTVRAQTAGIIMCLGSVYAIISSAILFGEIPSLRELVGGAIIILSAVASTVSSSRHG